MSTKKVKILLPFVVFILIGGAWLMKPKQTSIQALYPRRPETFVGDPMPYYNGKDFLIYYLEDERAETVGFHPFSLFRTRDFYQYEDVGQVLPFVNEEASIERALGTGSIIQDKKGLYHAFYTGHNGTLTPKEQIMHATSKDGESWIKIPEDTFQASAQYEANDFRDPYVFWVEEKQEYWMLITTRVDQTGVIARYRSTDLTNWEDEGIFFTNDLGNDSNLECPSLVHYQGKWYLTFSDQWEKRVVHYRVANQLTDSFEAVESTDYIDGAGFYAGRLETDGNDLYLVGWIPTKEKHEDRGNYNWAGNLAVHQLEATENGHLVPQLPTKALKKVHQEKISLTTNQTLTFKEESMAYEADYTPRGEEKIRLSFGTENHLVLDFANNTMGYYHADIQRLEGRSLVTEIPFKEEDTYSLQIVREGEILVLYLGNKALSNRIYSSKNTDMTIQVVD